MSEIKPVTLRRPAKVEIGGVDVSKNVASVTLRRDNRLIVRFAQPVKLEPGAREVVFRRLPWPPSPKNPEITVTAESIVYERDALVFRW